MKKYNVLVYGSGGRENALAYKISQSPLLNKLFLALPNDGFKSLGEEIIFDNFEDLAKKCVEQKVDLAVIGPEDPLSKGIVDILNSYGIKCIGANKKWAQLESSKKYAKEFMIKHKIPTAKYYVIENREQETGNSRVGLLSHPQEANASSKVGVIHPLAHQQEIDEILAKFSTPPVLKADGLAAGKGVHLSTDMNDAKFTLNEFLDGKYGQASSSVVVEERLEGEELSVISIFDGETLLPFVPARDYKRLYDGQIGPNTGGMGAYCPVELTKEQNADLQQYLKKLENALRKEQADFTGIVYSGLMLTPDGIKVLEYNMRFGDPETQPLMYHLDSDILEIFIKASEKQLTETSLKWKNGTTIAVVVAAQGYPENPKKGSEIKGVKEAAEKYGTTIFYAGVKEDAEMRRGEEVWQNPSTHLRIHASTHLLSSLLSNGGRVLTVCTNGSDVEKIREKIYKTIDEIDFSDKIFRKDIGKLNVKSKK